jgi:gamma-glutamylcyclotransferase (GGCT)/AIG2-like uncharacterized protein YtfP
VPDQALDCRRVFVYGTLRRGFDNPGREILEAHAGFLDEAELAGQLHDLGAYPALVCPAGDPVPVRGEVYELMHAPERGLERLDRYEGATGPDPLPYERRRASVDLASGDTTDAWVYVWTEDPPEGSRIDHGDWVEHLRDTETTEPGC